MLSTIEFIRSQKICNGDFIVTVFCHLEIADVA